MTPTTSIPRRRGRRGFTLVETMIVVAIMTVVIGAIGTAFITLLQIERKNSVTLDFASQCSRLQRLLRRYAASALQIVAPDGNSVQITSNAGAVSVLRFENDDGALQTIADNRIVFIPDIAAADVGQLVIRYATPLDDGAVPIFRKDNTIGYSPLEIIFVVGDFSADPAAPCNAITGPGYQSYTFRSRVSPRNAVP